MRVKKVFISMRYEQCDASKNLYVNYFLFIQYTCSLRYQYGIVMCLELNNIHVFSKHQRKCILRKWGRKCEWIEDWIISNSVRHTLVVAWVSPWKLTLTPNSYPLYGSNLDKKIAVHRVIVIQQPNYSETTY